MSEWVLLLEIIFAYTTFVICENKSKHKQMQNMNKQRSSNLLHTKQNYTNTEMFLSTDLHKYKNQTAADREFLTIYLFVSCIVKSEPKNCSDWREILAEQSISATFKAH